MPSCRCRFSGCGSGRRTRRGLLSDTPPHRIDPAPTQRSSVRNDGAAGNGHGGFTCATPSERARRGHAVGLPQSEHRNPSGHRSFTELSQQASSVENGRLNSAAVRGLFTVPPTSYGSSSRHGNIPLLSTHKKSLTPRYSLISHPVQPSLSFPDDTITPTFRCLRLQLKRVMC